LDIFFQVLTVSEAWARLETNWQPKLTAVETLELTCAHQRILAEPVVAADDVPPFSRSTVDGFAVRAADTFGASEGLPAFLTVMADIQMGQAAKMQLSLSHTARIATGGMLPPGADAVVMVEYTEEVDSSTVAVVAPVAPGENVVYRGEDIKQGALLLPAGHRLRPADIGALAAIGQTKVAVRQAPKVGIISTGDEIIPPEEVPQAGQVRDINSYSLGAAVSSAGGEPVYLGLSADKFKSVQKKVRAGLQNCDIVVLSGGSSIGTRDVAAKVLAKVGQPGILVHGVALRPGKPLLIALCEGKPVFGLPGHPVSALLTFDLFIKPTLGRLMGLISSPRPFLRARLTRNLASAPGREEHVRVKLLETETGLLAEPVLGKSGLITTLTEADGTIVIPVEKEGLVAGTEVEVYLL